MGKKDRVRISRRTAMKGAGALAGAAVAGIVPGRLTSPALAQTGGDKPIRIGRSPALDCASARGAKPPSRWPPAAPAAAPPASTPAVGYRCRRGARDATGRHGPCELVPRRAP